MTDRTTKALLLAIALGLWLHLLGPWVSPLHADAPSDIADIAHDVHLIARGLCTNAAICR